MYSSTTQICNLIVDTIICIVTKCGLIILSVLILNKSIDGKLTDFALNITVKVHIKTHRFILPNNKTGQDQQDTYLESFFDDH